MLCKLAAAFCLLSFVVIFHHAGSRLQQVTTTKRRTEEESNVPISDSSLASDAETNRTGNFVEWFDLSRWEVELRCRSKRAAGEPERLAERGQSDGTSPLQLVGFFSAGMWRMSIMELRNWAQDYTGRTAYLLADSLFLCGPERGNSASNAGEWKHVEPTSGPLLPHHPHRFNLWRSEFVLSCSWMSFVICLYTCNLRHKSTLWPESLFTTEAYLSFVICALSFFSFSDFVVLIG